MAVDAVPQDLVNELRSTFLKEVSEKGDNSIHQKDCTRVKTDDQWLRRFIAHQESDITAARKMMWTSLTWRKDFQVNDINENNIKMDIIIKGALFPYGKDIDGKHMLVFKSKMHAKGAVDSDDLKRCVIYWFERIERLSKGDQISIFFDMEGCGLSNMDMDFVKYLIGLFKEYYPYFLNYIIIYEMAWVLSAAFKIVKTWLPEKAIEKLKMVGKKNVFTYVPKNEALTCWGGDSNYTFSFVSEEKSESETNSAAEPNNLRVKKVHFVDRSPMSEHSAPVDSKDDGPLRVTPSGIITFVKEGTDLVSTLELLNTDSTAQISFKLKTTSPEKFKVKPSTGCLKPGSKETVTVTLLPGFQLGGLSKDKFLIMSCVVDDKEAANLDISQLWKNTANKKVYQIHLRCVQSGDVTWNGNVTTNHAPSSTESDSHLAKLSSTLTKINQNQAELSKSLKRMQNWQRGQFFLSALLGILIVYLLTSVSREIQSENQYCRDPRAP